jgi:cell division protein FtsB
MNLPPIGRRQNHRKPDTLDPMLSALLNFDNALVEFMFYAFALFMALLLLYVGYRLGKWTGNNQAAALIAQKEQELFTAQRGFKQLYESELNKIQSENAQFRQQNEVLTQRVEEYRRKAAGFGGLFSSGGKKADAMYALLLENESLEEALQAQNEKLKQERTDALREQMRNTSYRRVLMSQLLSDERIKSYVAEILQDDQRLPSPPETKALPSDKHEA